MLRWWLVALLAGCGASIAPDRPRDLSSAPDLAGAPSDFAQASDGDLAPPAGCDVVFEYRPGARRVGNLDVRGEWSSFQSGVKLSDDGSGTLRGTLALTPGLQAYKLVVDGAWELDPGARRRKYVGGVENSAVLVEDCHAPSLAIEDATPARDAISARIKFAPSVEGAALARATVSLRHDETRTPLLHTVEPDGIHVSASGLADGKYTLTVEATDARGRAARPLKYVFWIEASRFEWRDALIYMALVDRFRDGNSANNAARTSNVDARADWKGGDLDGVRAAIVDGTFEKLGVNTLWLSPLHQNPTTPWLADDGVHLTTGYHGYWPIRARAVEPRLGGEAALHALVAEAHAHGIRVLLDFVVNHVHREHEYVAAHPDWFRTGCVCGRAGCDWTAHRLDCLFSDYLPDVNWSVPEVSAQFSDDAAWWIDSFDLDGLRVDAVKHVEDLAVLNLRAQLEDEFKGARIFLTGETAMGWSDCGLACNAGEYGTIARYIGAGALDGQADFVLHHAVPYRAFARDDKGMIHVDYWTLESQKQYPAGAIMTPYIGSHDTPRFVTLSTGDARAGNKWDDVAPAPSGSEPYARHRLALSWLFALPGAPLLYYGDEYGEWGGADPNNRAQWRSTLSVEESATLTRARALGAARRELPALRRGDYRSLTVTEDLLVFARKDGASVAVVALNRAGGPLSLSVNLPGDLALADGTVLHDRLGGADVTVQSGALALSLDARGAKLLAR